MSKHEQGNRNERSASGKSREYKKYAAQVTAAGDLIGASVTWRVLKGCIVLHSMSAPPVQVCEMRQVVTSYLYSVTTGRMWSSGMDKVTL